MSTPDPAPRFENMTWLGKAAFLGGAAAYLTGRAVSAGLKRAATVLADAEDAFKRELDPNVEDAKIIDETPDV
ncbi:MAG: hypothetical protein RhofKO_09540 [Rhodothermales bacterium]